MSRHVNTYVAPADLAALTPFVERLARRYGTRRDEAESLSRTWWRVWRAVETYAPEAGRSFESWAIWHVRSGMFAVHRSERRRAARVVASSEYVDRAGSAPAEADVLEADRVSAALDVLTPRQREIFDLVFFQGLSHADAAAQLGVTHQAVSNVVRSGLGRLRREMGVAA